MLTLSANNKTYANYSLENFDKFMSKLIEKAMKHANINLTVKDYKKAVNESNPDHYENNAILTFDKHLDVFLINVPSIDKSMCHLLIKNQSMLLLLKTIMKAMLNSTQQIKTIVDIPLSN